ncbi:magnesium/cobalt transporter CorA [candidate division KSB1 bacterium]
MVHYIKGASKKRGLPPGSVVYTGSKTDEKIKIDMIDYTSKKLTEKSIKGFEMLFPYTKSPSITWINITGVHDAKLIEVMGKHFGLHPLIMEDIVSTGQRPKIEDHDNILFIVLKMLNYHPNTLKLDIEQVSLVVGKNFVISFQETEGDVFDGIRKRIREHKGRIRHQGADYLAYCIIDAIVDSYFTILESAGEEIEHMESVVLHDPSSSILNKIHILKRDMVTLRKSVWPLREVINFMQKGGSSLIKKSTYLYLSDVYDHTVQVIDTIESYRDMASGLQDVYLSSLSNKMNEVMKVLTIFASIFIPLTFIAGVYGMNFDYMPELSWKYGYFGVWGVIMLLVGCMLYYFRKKKWI